jgi:hypothetical protein
MSVQYSKVGQYISSHLELSKGRSQMLHTYISMCKQICISTKNPPRKFNHHIHEITEERKILETKETSSS